MGLQKPYRRTVRQLADGSYSKNGNGKYVQHPDFACEPTNHLRAFEVLVKDFLQILDFVNPSDVNLKTYSFRIHELLIRTCIEIESNFFAILSENGYSKNSNWNMNDFKRVDKSHHLSSYEVRIPLWHGEFWLGKPFKNWKENRSLDWFNAYNKIKHERHLNFERSNFLNLTEALCGLAALIASQFMGYSANAKDIVLAIGGPEDGMDLLVGDFFRVKYPRDWGDEEKYDFNWQELENQDSPFENYNYNS